MLRRVWLLVAPLLVVLLASVASAADPPTLPVPIVRPPVQGPIVRPDLTLNLEPIPVAFSAVANRYTGVDAATTFDLNGDLVGDLKVTATEVLMQNGAQVQLLDPPVLNLDNVHLMPAAGYAAKAPVQLSRVYAAKLSDGNYAKFMVLQATPKVTIWFMFGRPTSSVLTADGQNSEANLNWDPLEDADLGYNIYRYEVNDNSYSVTQLNDFTVEETSFVDRTAGNRYYLYVVQAVMAGGLPGSLTTTVAVFVTHQARSLVVPQGAGSATLDGDSVPVGTPSEIRNGLMMIPASLLEHTGANVSVNNTTGQVTISRRLESVTYSVVLTVDSPRLHLEWDHVQDRRPALQEGQRRHGPPPGGGARARPGRHLQLGEPHRHGRLVRIAKSGPCTSGDGPLCVRHKRCPVSTWARSPGANRRPTWKGPNSAYLAETSSNRIS